MIYDWPGKPTTSVGKHPTIQVYVVRSVFDYLDNPMTCKVIYLESDGICQDMGWWAWWVGWPIRWLLEPPEGPPEGHLLAHFTGHWIV